MLYLLVLILSLYFVFLLYLLVPSFKSDHDDGQSLTLTGLSIVVPFKNEERNLPLLIESICAMNKDQMDLEFIFIDDHSSDKSRDCIDQSLPNSTIISARGEGKKKAIQQGVEHASHGWILTLDADVQLPKSFIDELSVQLMVNAKMLVLPIKPSRRRGLVSAFFDLEFIALQGVGLGMADKGIPLLSNGACLLFEKEAFLLTLERRNDTNIASGDDIFSMFAIAEEYGNASIRTGLAMTPIESRFPRELKKLFRQRTRWISKTAHVTNFRYQFAAYSMAAIHLLTLILLFATYSGAISFPFFLGLLAIKWCGEWIFFWHLTRSFDRRELIFYVPFAQLLYPFYIFVLIASGINYRLRNDKPTWDAA